MQDDWIDRWLPTILLALAGLIFAVLLVESLRKYSMLVDLIKDFQTLITGVLAIGGVWWSLDFHRKQQALAHAREDEALLRSIVVAIYQDLSLLAGDSQNKIRFARSALSDAQFGNFPTEDQLSQLETVLEIPSVDYWRPRLGLWSEYGQRIIALAQLRESLSFSLRPTTGAYFEDRLKKAIEKHSRCYAFANEMREAIAKSHSTIIEEVRVDL